MKIKILGTAAAEAWPALFCQCDACKKAREIKGKNIRTRSSCLIDDTIMIDFPPDNYMHVINNNFALDAVEYLFITHSHSDHFYPKDLLMRNEPFAHKPIIKTLKAYGNQKVVELYDTIIKNKNFSGEVVDFRQCKYYQNIKIPDGEVIPLPAVHAPGEDSMIYIIKKDGKKLLYGYDSGYFSEETWNYIKNEKIDCVLLECTLGIKVSYKHHMNYEDVINTKNRLQKLGITDEKTKFVATHFSHNSELLHSEFVKLFSKHDIEVAYDGIELVI